MVDPKMVDIRGLKRWAANNLASDSKLRELIIRECDFLSVDEFVFKMMVWLGLAGIEDEERLQF